MPLGTFEGMAAPLPIEARPEGFIQCILRQFGVGSITGEG
jgi:hypothetical protein